MFPGYGADGWMRVMGRVLVAAVPAMDQAVDRSSTWQALRVNIGQFVTSELPFATVRVECGGQTWEVTADREGYVDDVLDAHLPPGQHPVTMTPLEPPGEESKGTVHVHPVGVELVVVSDIDDTVIDSGIAKGVVATLTTALLHDSAARVPLEGAPRLCRALGGGLPGRGDRSFFYLSTSPWNLAGFLCQFLERHGFPAGPLLLTDWGPGNAGLLRIGAHDHKSAALRRLAVELPSARFVLLGDSGQQDADIYSDFALEFPGRIAAIYIRRAHGAAGSRADPALERSALRLAGAGVPFLLADESEPMLRHAQQHGLAVS